MADLTTGSTFLMIKNITFSHWDERLWYLRWKIQSMTSIFNIHVRLVFSGSQKNVDQLQFKNWSSNEQVLQLKLSSFGNIFKAHMFWSSDTGTYIFAAEAYANTWVVQLCDDSTRLFTCMTYSITTSLQKYHILQSSIVMYQKSTQ